MKTHTESGKAGFIGALADGLTRFWRRRSQLDELYSFEPEELKRLAQDAGLTFADLLELAKRDGRSAELLERRLAALGIDPASIDPGTLRDLQRCCSQCDSKALCAHELEDQPRTAMWPSYCPNQDTLAALTQMKCCH